MSVRRYSPGKYSVTKEQHTGKICRKQFISKTKIVVMAAILSINYICASQCSRFFVLFISFNPYNKSTMEYYLPFTYAHIIYLTSTLSWLYYRWKMSFVRIRKNNHCILHSSLQYSLNYFILS